MAERKKKKPETEFEAEIRRFQEARFKRGFRVGKREEAKIKREILALRRSRELAGDDPLSVEELFIIQSQEDIGNDMIF